MASKLSKSVSRVRGQKFKHLLKEARSLKTLAESLAYP
jgi:hypothetical protein